MTPTDLFQTDEPLADILRAWTQGEKCFACPPAAGDEDLP